MPNYIVDTYAWIEYLGKNEKYAPYFSGTNLKTPSIVLAELARILYRRGIGEKMIELILNGIIDRSEILDLDAAHAAKGGKIADLERIPLADAIIYSYADAENVVLTGDGHFSGKVHVQLVKA